MSHNQSKELKLEKITALGDLTNAGSIELNCENNSHAIKLKGPPHSATATYTLTFPSTIQADQALKTDANGNLSWEAYASLASPNFSGTPTAPTANQGTNTTQLATTAFVSTAVANVSTEVPSVTGPITPSSPYALSSPSGTPSGIEEIYLLDPSGALTVTLPNLSTVTVAQGFRYTIKNLSTNTITIQRSGTDYIDFSTQTSYSLPAQYDAATLTTDGNNWYLV